MTNTGSGKRLRRKKGPTPKVRYTSGAWVVYWYFNYKQFMASTGLTRKEDENIAKILASQFVSALLADIPTVKDFPADYRKTPKVLDLHRRENRNRR